MFWMVGVSHRHDRFWSSTSKLNTKPRPHSIPLTQLRKTVSEMCQMHASVILHDTLELAPWSFTPGVNVLKFESCGYNVRLVLFLLGRARRAAVASFLPRHFCAATGHVHFSKSVQSAPVLHNSLSSRTTTAAKYTVATEKEKINYDDVMDKSFHFCANDANWLVLYCAFHAFLYLFSRLLVFTTTGSYKC